MDNKVRQAIIDGNPGQAAQAYLESKKIGHDVEKVESPLSVSMITWSEWRDNSHDDITVAECIDAALNSLPLNIRSKISKIDISRSGDSSKEWALKWHRPDPKE